MTASSTKSATSRSPWSHTPSARGHHKSSTTPLGVSAAHTPSSVGQSAPPLLSPLPQSPKHTEVRTPSPNYFSLSVEGGGGNPTDSNAGQHAKKNWQTPGSAAHAKAAASPHPIPHETNPDLEEFRKQSEAHAFSLSQRNFSGLSAKGQMMPPSSPLAKEPLRPDWPSRRSSKYKTSSEARKGQELPGSDEMDVDENQQRQGGRPLSAVPDPGSFFDIPRNESPMTMNASPADSSHDISQVDQKHPRLSLPQTRVHHSSPSSQLETRRAETLPSALRTDGTTMIAPEKLLQLFQDVNKEKILLLDLRVSPQYSQSRLKGAMNLCIPTTLLKRPSFNCQRLADTLTINEEKTKFSKWKDMEYIVVYDGSSQTLKDALSSVNTLKKFTNEGWKGGALVIRGGFKEVLKALPQLVEKLGGGEGPKGLTLNPGNDAMPVAGGCPMPATQTAANPFFGNIRQNMDLIGGVGQMPIKLPEILGSRGFNALPIWLRDAAQESDKGKVISDKFLHIEKDEQHRMQTALSGNVSYGTPGPNQAKIQVAGIEKGTKNRYKDMLPYDHSRVRLQNVSSEECDYINASHVKAEWSNRHYIATQAPVPTTFEDFWRLVWEQESRIIVMLSAETEGGQRKCHPYWDFGSYGQMKLKVLSEKRVSLHPPSNHATNFKKSQLSSPMEKPAQARRRAATNSSPSGQDAARDESATGSTESQHVIVRKLTLSHAAFPFQPMREITQIQYSQWPDFGAPAHATDVLGVVEHCNSVARQYNKQQKMSPLVPAPEGEPPIVVHCSAGCGRTGAFCTIDSVIDMLKTQRITQLSRDPSNFFAQNTGRKSPINGADDGEVRGEAIGEDEMDVVDEEMEKWELRDDVDLIAKAVEDFRLQRLSMVQTLRQYVLCYESVLEWLVKEVPEKFRRETLRRSFHA